MLSRALLILALLLETGGLFSQSEMLAVYFKSGRFDLEELEKRKLDDFIKQYRSASGEIFVKAFTDSDGDVDYNINLSKQRADAVVHYFAQSGLVVSGVESFGESAPLASNADEEGKALNRSVQVFFKSPDKETATVQSRMEYESLDELMQALRPEAEIHCIDNRKDTILICEKGTALEFKAYCFEEYDPFRCVEIHVLEAHQRSDMLLAGLSTKSGPDWLVSGGMVAVDAIQDDKKLKMNSAKPAAIFIPAKETEPGMKLFYSEPDDINWHLDEEGQVYEWFRGGIGSGVNRLSNPVKCRFFWCRIGRAFQRKESRLPLSDGFFTLGGTGDANLNEQELAAVFGEGTMNELNKKLIEANKRISEMNYYAFQSSRLGYINCDYFYNKSNDLIFATTKSANNVLADVNMVFTKRNVVMNGSSVELGTHSFANVPEGEKVVIVGIGIQNGESVLAIQESNISENQSLNFEPCDASLIKRKVKMYLD